MIHAGRNKQRLQRAHRKVFQRVDGVPTANHPKPIKS
jgi:hypothetical protein